MQVLAHLQLDAQLKTEALETGMTVAKDANVQNRMIIIPVLHKNSTGIIEGDCHEHDRIHRHRWHCLSL